MRDLIPNQINDHSYAVCRLVYPSNDHGARYIRIHPKLCNQYKLYYGVSTALLTMLHTK